MKSKFFGPRVVLPVIVLLGIMVMGMRAADMWAAVSSGKLSLHPAQAADATPPKDAAAAPAAAAAASAPQSDTPTEPTMAVPPPDDTDDSPASLEVLKQLSDRREQLEKRAHDLDTREDLIKITEQRVDQKIKELETLRVQLQAMVGTANDAQQAQLDNLVKIYETMKPDDAAKIFDALDMPVLLGVIQHMKPAHSALILAKMPPEKAKEITVDLTKQDQLPQVK